jgi:sialate O-acetylesterase
MLRTQKVLIASTLLIGLAILAGNAQAARKNDPPAEFRMAKIFSDNMVLQQGKPIKVWGWAKPRANVSVMLTQDSGDLGKAAAEPEKKDSGEYSVTVKYVEKNPPKLKTQTVNVKAGADGKWLVKFDPAKASFQPTWIIAKTGGASLAVQNVLIGEIWVCAGQSNMGWGNFNRKDREGASADFPGLRYIAWEDSWYKPLDDISDKRKPSWRECSPEAVKGFSAVPYLYGMFIHRYLKTPVGIINVARGGTLGQTWCMRSELDNIDNKIIKTVLADYDAETATWDDPKKVEQIMADWKKACQDKTVEHAKKVAQAKAEGKKPPRLRLPRAPGDPRSGWSPPAGLFNATIMPIKDLGVAGVLYYQGENQAFTRWTRYEYTFPKVAVSFRKAFGDEKLPFGCISQPGWGTFGLDPEIATIAEGYAIVRDIQKRALAKDPNAGMIATYPAGNSYIHPGEKLPVAEYASLWALANVYKKPVVHRGNEYKSMTIKGSKTYLFFDSDPRVYERWKHIERNAHWQVLPCPKQGSAPLEGFIIAGADRRWYPASGKQTFLDGKNCIEVWSDLVAEPVAVRYGWANWPTGNLVGRERIPVATFRTDDWPIPQGVSYSKEAQQKCKDILAALKERGVQQAADRKLRQLLFDLPKLEHELHVRMKSGGGLKSLVAAKLARIENVLNELEKDKWVARGVGEYAPLVDRLKALRAGLEATRTEAEKIEGKK